MKSLHGPVITRKLTPEELVKYHSMGKPKLPQSATKRHVDWEWPLHRNKGENENAKN